MKPWLLSLALLPLLHGMTRAQSGAPLLAPGPNALTGPSEGRSQPLAPPAASIPTARPSLRPLPGTGGPSLDELEAPSKLGVQPNGARAAASRAPSRVEPARLLSPGAAVRVLQTAIKGAVSRNSSLQGAAARNALAVAKQRSAAAFLPGAPALGAAYVTDQAIRNRNARDAEISIGTQIWLPGEGTASVRAADADLSRLKAEGARQLLEVAGEVREALAAVAAGEADQRAAEARSRDAKSLEADLARRVRSRDVAEAELLVANADRIEADANSSEKTAILDEARVDFRTLTGLDPNTAALNEPNAPASAGGTLDPRLTEARRAVEVAQANRDLAAIQSRDSPEIALVGRRTRDIGGFVTDNSLGLQVRIPFATQTRNAPRRAAAEVEYTDAVATFARLERQLGGGERRARIALASAQATSDLAGKRADVFGRQRSLFERSFTAGETSLADLIRARTLAFQADAARGKADVGVRQARGRLNQALGFMP